MSDGLLIGLIGLALTGVAVVPVMLRLRRMEQETDEAEALALEYGLNEPATLHPRIDPDRCIATGSCVDVCPEGKVLGIRGGRAIAVAPASCIGHGLCERSCPMEAIQLVFGTSKRGVDIPRIKEDFETNVPGLYVVGELGGMGLIRNAFTQGRQCVDGIVSSSERSGNGVLDLLVVGAGPAGLSASLTAKHHRLRFVALDREPDIGGTVRHYPRKKLVMTEPVKIPGFGRVGGREVRKEELIEVWTRVADEADLPLETDRTVDAVERDGDAFHVRASGSSYRARRVILAIGRRGVPRKLGVPGEDGSHVQYGLAEPESFEGDRILVVGGGDSAVEAALALAEQRGTRVRLSYRGDRFRRIKPGNRERMDAVVGRRELDVHWSTTVNRIEQDRVWLSPAEGDGYAVEADQVFIFAGGELPTPFLESCGVRIDTKFGAPR